jgi:hypothetical protein
MPGLCIQLPSHFPRVRYIVLFGYCNDSRSNVFNRCVKNLNASGPTVRRLLLASPRGFWPAFTGDKGVCASLRGDSACVLSWVSAIIFREQLVEQRCIPITKMGLENDATDLNQESQFLIL